jgi:hypothetical protein
MMPTTTKVLKIGMIGITYDSAEALCRDPDVDDSGKREIDTTGGQATGGE